MSTDFFKRWLILPALLALAGCASAPIPHATGGGGLIHERNQGYSLLYKLMADESNVGKIFFLKSADSPVKSLVKEIGTACQATKKQMDDFARTDKQIDYDITDLPYIEQRGRVLQAKDDEKALLFSTGKDFELRLIFTQAQAIDYAQQLSKALAEKEDNPLRKDFLKNWATQCDDFHKRLMQLLTIQT